jgi:hypothetical protein
VHVCEVWNAVRRSVFGGAFRHQITYCDELRPEDLPTSEQVCVTSRDAAATDKCDSKHEYWVEEVRNIA